MSRDHFIGAYWGAWLVFFGYCFWTHFVSADAFVALLLSAYAGGILTAILIATR